MSQRRFTRSLMRSAAAHGQAAAHSAVTLSARLPLFAGYAFAPHPDTLAEWNRACTEKVAAGWEGAFAAGAAWQAMMIRSAFAWPNPAGLAHDLLDLADKAARPAQRKVRANAKRLGRG